MNSTMKGFIGFLFTGSLTNRLPKDVTSDVFLAVAREMRAFAGLTEADFRNWVYAIAANHANAWIRKTTRRRRLLAQAAIRIAADDRGKDEYEPDWPTLYRAILELKPKNQTIITLRFFENMEFEQIAQIVGAKASTVRVTLHRILNKLRRTLQPIIDG